jgi:hypothetical protein
LKLGIESLTGASPPVEATTSPRGRSFENEQANVELQQLLGEFESSNNSPTVLLTHLADTAFGRL